MSQSRPTLGISEQGERLLSESIWIVSVNKTESLGVVNKERICHTALSCKNREGVRKSSSDAASPRACTAQEGC